MNNNQGGYIAFITVLLIASLVLIVGTSTSLLSINDLLSSYAGKKNEETINIVESCVEDALLRLNESGLLPTSVTVESNTCTITTNSQVGSTWDFSVSSPTSGDFVKRMRVVVQRTTTVSVTSWLEQ